METEQDKDACCEVCEKEQAEICCSECQKIHSYCKCCFDLSHRSPNKKTHKPKPLTPDISKVSSALTWQMYKCPLHFLEARKYVCTVDKEVACADCFVIGDHVGHDPIAFEKARDEILEAFIKELELAKKYLARSKELSAGIETERKKEQEAFATYISTVNGKFKIIQEILVGKQNSFIEIIENESAKVEKFLVELGKEVEKIQERLDERVKYLKDSHENLSKVINPDNFAEYKDLKPENLQEMHNIALNELKKKLDFADNYKIAPSIDLEGLATSIQTLDFAASENIKVEGTYYSENKELRFEFDNVKSDCNGMPVEILDLASQKYLEETTLTNRKVIIANYIGEQEAAKFRVALGLPWNYAITEVYKPGLTLLTQTQFQLSQSIATDNFSTVIKDTVKGSYYLGSTFNSCKLLYKYDNLSDLINSKGAQEINLEQAFDGWYIAAKNGYLYHSVSNTNMIGITDLSNGKLLEMCQLPYASYRNGPGKFKHQGYTDIAMFLDDKTDKIYVMYETENNQEFKISEVLETPKHGIRIGSTWVIPGERKVNFCYAFIYNKAAYFGRSHDVGAIQYVYSLNDCKPVETGPIQIVPSSQSVDIHYMTLIPSDRILIVCVSEPYRISIYDLK